jgi:hypothetical protein
MWLSISGAPAGHPLCREGRESPVTSNDFTSIKVLVVVGQPASIGTLTVTVARASGCEVAYLPGPPMRRLADPDPGTGKTDARDAYVIADTPVAHTSSTSGARPLPGPVAWAGHRWREGVRRRTSRCRRGGRRR